MIQQKPTVHILAGNRKCNLFKICHDLLGDDILMSVTLILTVPFQQVPKTCSSCRPDNVIYIIALR